MSLSGKVAVVTGAGSGIGRAAALLLARRGARVAAIDRTDDDLHGVADAIARAGGEAIGIAADISDDAAMARAYEQAGGRWGRIDIVFANAGINGVWAPLDELTIDEWRTTLEVNLTGTFLTVKHALPMLKRDGGSVIITSSVNGTRIFSNSGATAYSCSKAAQVAFAKMIALELARDRIRVNVVCPGWIKTNISENTEQRDVEAVKVPAEFPEGRVPLTDGLPARAEQVAELVCFLASDASSHITGTEIFIDGAESLLLG
jgi:NAD(P)-dependent dehydrogenase (short-subunit alcohol dehydrogenase family)